MTINEILSQLDAVRRSGHGWLARCPAHSPDQHPSLSVAEGDKGILLRCWSRGCTPNEIVHALGRTLSDLFYDAPISSHQQAIHFPNPRSSDWRRTSSDQLHRAEALRDRADRTLLVATGVDLLPISHEDTDLMMDAIAEIYADRDLAEQLERAAFQLRDQGIKKEKERHALRRASNS